MDEIRAFLGEHYILTAFAGSVLFHLFYRWKTYQPPVKDEDYRWEDEKV
jgi:hypothetical protein